jgi:hypothetical protein
MNVDIVNPLEIENWDDLVLARGKASFFHSAAWARVLHESYGYKPLYFASFENGKLTSLMPFMEVNSWLTGKRGVSLPFTDQVPVIAPDRIVFERIVKNITEYGEKAGWKYIEWRDGSLFPQEANASESHYTHELNLSKTEKELFSGLRDSTRRNIKKADKAGVSVEISQSLESTKSFYRLNCITRKRHGLPPQPFSFFERLLEHVISKGHGILVSAAYSGEVIASSVFLHFGKGAIYKYGASDLAHQDLRPNNVVMWEAIKWCKERDFETFNFGRTEPENEGLLQFKRGWGAEERQLRYCKYDLKKKSFKTASIGVKGFYNQIFNVTPIPLLRFIGAAMYKHIG